MSDVSSRLGGICGKSGPRFGWGIRLTRCGAVTAAKDRGPVNDSVSAGLGRGYAGQFLPPCGRRSSNRMAKWFKAAFQPLIGIVQRCDASWIARYISLIAEAAL